MNLKIDAILGILVLIGTAAAIVHVLLRIL
jgi:hypothetical protein